MLCVVSVLQRRAPASASSLRPRTTGGCSITGGYVYRGEELPELDGWYVYGDFCSSRVWAVDVESNDPPVVLADAHPAGSITSFGVTPAGEVAVLTMNGDAFTLTELDRAAAPSR